MAVPGETFWGIFFEKMESDETFEQMIAQNPQMEQAIEQAKVLLNNDSYLVLMALLCAGSVVGAAFMLKRRVVGFHIYTLAHLLIIALPLIMFRSMDFSIGGTIFSLIIIGLYALAIFKKPAATNNDNEYTY
jgi:hypothetical protein